MVYLSCALLYRRLRICSAFDPFLCLLSIRTIPSDVPLVRSMQEAVLPSLSLVLVSILVPALAISLAFGLFLRLTIWACLCWLLPLLAASLLLYIKDMQALPLQWLWLALASIAPLGIPAVALELLALVLLFHPSAEVIVRSAILLKFAIKVFDGPRLFPG